MPIDVKATYLALAACTGLMRPLPPPTVVIGPGDGVACAALAGRCLDAACTRRYPTRCTGLHTMHPRRVRVGFATTDALPHELLHDVLCQLGNCDHRHEGAAWGAGLP